MVEVALPSQTLTVVLKPDNRRIPVSTADSSRRACLPGVESWRVRERVSRYMSEGTGATQRRRQNCSGGREAQ